ncbi:MAG TPA: hypothetical protein VFS16_05715 [Acidimicrobiia bacterium]|nr:hypothetical protein [Acidimicrobiia bacterium]
MPQRASRSTQGDRAEGADGGAGERHAPEGLPDDVVHDALRGDPEAEAAVDEGWERAKSMEGEAPTG